MSRLPAPLCPEELMRVRSFIAEKIAGESSGGSPFAPDAESVALCTSVFLMRHLGRNWELCSGMPTVFDFTQVRWIPRPGGGGVFDGTRWHLHHWVQKGQMLLDMTAYLHGSSEPYVLTGTDDVRYRRTPMGGSDLSELMRRARPVATSWLDEYQGHFGPYRKPLVQTRTQPQADARCFA